jgi:hypothetical protein
LFSKSVLKQVLKNYVQTPKTFFAETQSFGNVGNKTFCIDVEKSSSFFFEIGFKTSFENFSEKGTMLETSRAKSYVTMLNVKRKHKRKHKRLEKLCKTQIGVSCKIFLCWGQSFLAYSFYSVTIPSVSVLSKCLCSVLFFIYCEVFLYEFLLDLLCLFVMRRDELV